MEEVSLLQIDYSPYRILKTMQFIKFFHYLILFCAK